MTDPELYLTKESSYFGVEQTWVVKLIPGNDLRILDVGCGDGLTGAFLKATGKAREVHGVELVPSAAQRAEKVLDSILVGNIETLALPFEPESFDCIIATEVLEHLVDPWRTVQVLTTFLKPGGRLVASIPNVRHYTVLWSLMVKGQWNYSESGILDRTHLRFFTRSSFVALFEQARLEVEELGSIMSRRSWIVNLLSGKLGSGLLTHRYKCRARKP